MAGLVIEALALPEEVVEETLREVRPPELSARRVERVSDHDDIARGQRAIRQVLETLEEWREKGSRPDG